MTTATMLRNRYARDAVTTASPARLLIMLYDRLVKDMVAAEQAVLTNDIQGAHNSLRHAQDIVRELADSLDLRVWPEGEGLLMLYYYVIDQLITANVTKSVEHIRNARDVVEPIREAWHQASLLAAS